MSVEKKRLKIRNKKPNMVVHIYNPSTLEAEAGGL
jgi:hypothetical protein